MSDPIPMHEVCFGFLTVIEIDPLGYCGGLLILSAKGRPVEFHCTAPTSANSAQRILYGQTLKPFLYCDQIGMALVEKSKSTLSIIVTLETELVGLTELAQAPIVVLKNEDNADDFNTLSGKHVELDGQSMSILGTGNHTSEAAEKMLQHFQETLPLTEPFERIFQAINAAHKVAA